MIPRCAKTKTITYMQGYHPQWRAFWMRQPRKSLVPVLLLLMINPTLGAATRATFPLGAPAAVSDASWFSMPGPPAITNTIDALAVDPMGHLLAAGSFSEIGGVKANNIAKWNGNTWSPLGGGINGWVGSLAMAGTNVYAGGWFSMAGEKEANNVAKWDGNSWSAVGAGTDDLVFSVATSGSKLYACGVFMSAGGKPMESIAQWDGTSWAPVGSLIDNWVSIVATVGSELYAGGGFVNPATQTSTYIARWNGNSWSPLGSGLNAAVDAFAFQGNHLYVGGEFTAAGGQPANYIARWDGKSWSSVGAGMDHWVLALAFSGTDLYAGGLFTEADGVTVNRICKWDGKGWSALGSGITAEGQTAPNVLGGGVFALAVSGTNLYVGGKFTAAGGKAVMNIARLTIPAAKPSVNVLYNRSWPNQPLTLTWNAVPGLKYQIETTGNLGEPWTPLLAAPRSALAVIESYDFPGPLQARAFFRVVQTDGTPSAPRNMSLIPAGRFQMGNAFETDNTFNLNGEVPVHEVNLSAFYIDQFLVTRTLWRTVYQWALTNGYKFDNVGLGKAANHPVYAINWFDAVKWCNARSEMEGRVSAYYTSGEQNEVYRVGRIDLEEEMVKWNAGYRLPTEAEWEKAARGGLEGMRFPWGDTITHDQANYQSSGSAGDISKTRGFHPKYATGGQPYTSPVDAFPPNGYGLYDMAGNMASWCWDRFGRYYYEESPTDDPRGPVEGTYKIIPPFYDRTLRGGCWYFGTWTRVSSRINWLPLLHNAFPGGNPTFVNSFRCVLPANPL